MKSVVLEITGRHAVVVNDDGDFIKIRNRNFKVGQRIITHDLRFKRLKFASAAAAAAMVLFVAGGAYAYYTPYTEVSLDVNPSMVLQINYFNKVIGVAAMNADAEQIAEKLDIINDDVNTAMDEVVNELSEQGYIDTDTDAAIVVTSTSQDQTRAQEMLQTAERKIEQKTERLRIRAEVLGDCVGQQLVTRAREYGVSPGKLMLVEKYAISTGDPATVDVTAWLDKPVKEIMAATKANKKAAKGKDNTGDAETSPSP
ncbi:MAG: anti-sigma factor domain-containing protein, partial [Bacillota bacterium]